MRLLIRFKTKEFKMKIKQDNILINSLNYYMVY